MGSAWLCSWPVSRHEFSGSCQLQKASVTSSRARLTCATCPRGCSTGMWQGCVDVEVEEQCSHPWSTVWLLQACASTPRLSLAQHTLRGMEVVVVLVCISTSPWTSGKLPAPAQVGIRATSYWSTLFSHCALSSACLCLLTNTCCRWMAGAAAPCTRGRGFPLYIFTREAAPTRADHGPVC